MAKQMKLLWIAIALVLQCSCTQKATRPAHESEMQCRMDSIINHYCNANDTTFNTIKVAQLFGEYQRDLKALFRDGRVDGFDALLQGLRVNDVVVNDTTYKHVSFNLINGMDATPKITFDASYYCKADDAATDSVFQRLAGIGNLERVVFSGKVLEQGALSAQINADNAFLIRYPTFHIIIDNIRTHAR